MREGSYFLKKRTKKLLFVWRGAAAGAVQTNKVFLLLLLRKKKPFLA